MAVFEAWWGVIRSHAFVIFHRQDLVKSRTFSSQNVNFTCRIRNSKEAVKKLTNNERAEE